MSGFCDPCGQLCEQPSHFLYSAAGETYLCCLCGQDEENACDECATRINWRCQTCTHDYEGNAPNPPICRSCYEDFDG